MNLEEFLVAIVLPITIILVVGPVAYFLGKSRRLTWLSGLGAAVVSVSIGLVVAMFVQEGWDAILYLIIILFGCAPFAGSLLLGGLLGWLSRKP